MPAGIPAPIRIPKRARRYYGLTSNTQQMGELSSLIGSINYAVEGASKKEEETRRAQALMRAYKAGTIDIDKMGPADTKLFASLSDDEVQNLESSVDAGGIGGFFENLGEDITSAVKGLPGAAKATASAAWHDITSKGPALGGESRVMEEIVKPTIDQYKYTYLGHGAPKDSTLWSRIYENPLGPILDVATVATLGAGGTSAAGRALASRGAISPESALARMGRTDTRPPIALSPDLVSRRPDLEPGQIDRYYGRSPLRKGLQILTDFGGTKWDRLHGWQESSALRTQARESSMVKEALASKRVRQHASPLIESRKNLSQDEVAALDIISRVGAGDQALPYMDAMEEMVRRSLAGENEPGQNYADYAGSVDRQFAESRALVPDSVRNLVRDPSQSPKLITALQETRRQSDLTRERMDIAPEEWAERIGRSRSILETFMDRPDEPGGPEGGPLTPPEGPPEPSDPDIPPPQPGSPDIPTTYQSLDDGPRIGGYTWREAADAMEEEFDLTDSRETGMGRLEVYEDMAAGDILGGGEGNVNFVLRDPESGETLAYGNIQYFGDETQFFVAADQPEYRQLIEGWMRNYNEGRGTQSPQTSQGAASAVDPEAINAAAESLEGALGPFQQWKRDNLEPDGGISDDNLNQVLFYIEDTIDADLNPDAVETTRLMIEDAAEDWGDVSFAAITQHFESASSGDGPEPNPVEMEAFNAELENLGVDIPQERGVFEIPDTVDDFLAMLNQGQTRDMLDEEFPEDPGRFLLEGIDFEQVGPDQMPTPEDRAKLEELAASGNAAAQEVLRQWDEKGLGLDEVSQVEEIEPEPEDVVDEATDEDVPDELRAELEEDALEGVSEEVEENVGLSDEAMQVLGRDPEAEGPDVPEDETGEPVGDDYFGPVYMPDEAARGFAPTSRLGRFMKGKEQSPEFSRNRADLRKMNLSSTTYSNVLKSQQGDIGDDPNAFIAGVARYDARAFVDHVAQRERLLTNNVFSEEWLNRFALKTEDGEMVTAMSQNEVRDKYGEQWALVHPKFPIQWYKREMDLSKQVADYAAANNIDAADENAVRQIDDLLQGAAKDFVSQEVMGARKLPGVIVPRDALEYQLKIARAADPFAWKAGAFYARFMHRWRTLTLAYMPRWALNTAIGSFILSVVKGVSPEDFYTARKWRREGVFDQPDEYPHLAGIELNHLIGFETLEPFAQGRTSAATGVDSGPTTRWIIERVQAIEDYFRRASFVHSLRRESQEAMSEVGDILIGHENLRGSMNDAEYRDQLINDPQLMERVLRDVNRFSYNFAVMGPFERRYLRQFVPFWGWYKFVSKLAWSMPIDNPIKANLIYNLGMIGADMEDQLGTVPEWIKGALILNLDENKNLSYMSTLGMNPFAQFINPFSPAGTIGGTISASQGAPAVQATMSAFGLDTLRGGETSISPVEGIGQDFFGSWIDVEEERETDPTAEAAARRFIGTLARSVPQVRMLERGLAGGRNTFPESIPVIAQRPMPTKPESRRTGPVSAGLEMIGLLPRQYDLGAYQSLLKKRVRYAKTKNRRELKNLLENLGG